MNLALLQQQAESGQFQAVTQSLLSILSHLRRGEQWVVADNAPPLDSNAIESIYSNLASTFTILFTNKKFILSQKGYEMFCAYNDEINAIFSASCYGSSKHIVESLLTADPEAGREGEVQFTADFMRRLFAIMTLDSMPESLISLFSKLPKTIIFPAICGMLSNRLVLTHQAQANKNTLLQAGNILEGAELTDWTMSILAASYMFASYATTPEKHQIKKEFNQVVRQYLGSKQVKEPFAGVRKAKEKPIFLVVVDNFCTDHAIYRCYAPSIEQLSEQFDLVLLHGKGKADENSKKIFTRCIELDFSFSGIKKIVGTLIKLKPDLIYYPSIGMSRMTVVLSNLRLAPIQLCSSGHPATTHSDKIDYCLGQQELFSETVCEAKTLCHSETLILMPNCLNFTLNEQLHIPTPDLRLNPEVIRIGIPAHSFKLNMDFIDCCLKIERKASRKIQFCFFPNMKGVLFDACKKQLIALFPTCEVFPQEHYSDYMANLNSCDIHFSTFPFGMTNGVVDSSLLGLPILTLDGLEMHSHADSGLIHMLSLPDWLSAQTLDEFEAAALKLIEDDELRVKLSSQTIEANARKVFLSGSMDNKSFLDVVNWIYGNHEYIQKQQKPVWKMEDSIDLVTNVHTTG